MADHNAMLWAQNVLPYVDMTLKGWLYYQGENNCGTFHGNSQTRLGCMCHPTQIAVSCSTTSERIPASCSAQTAA